jgi:hypothetical protein
MTAPQATRHGAVELVLKALATLANARPSAATEPEPPPERSTFGGHWGQQQNAWIFLRDLTWETSDYGHEKLI